jgi:hypothetical protein
MFGYLCICTNTNNWWWINDNNISTITTVSDCELLIVIENVFRTKEEKEALDHFASVV